MPNIFFCRECEQELDENIAKTVDSQSDFNKGGKENISIERNCQSCKYYTDGYCENLELQPNYPTIGCAYFENKDQDVLDKIKAEMGRCKTLHEMQLSERDTKGKLLISDIFCHVVEILDRYRNEVGE